MIPADVPAPPALQAPAPAIAAPAVRPTHPPHAPGDPLENFNRRMFDIHQSLDRRFLRPAAMGYKHIVPRALRTGLRHFFSNLGEPVVFANFMLQLNPAKAVLTAVRFVINSTVGIAGTIDVAKSKGVNLPHRPNGFGDTLGYYGVKPGPYIFLPLVGPSDFRDLIGGQADGMLLPLAVGTPFDRIEYSIPKTVITGLDERAEVDDELRSLFADALDPYATLRSVYLQDRAGEIAELKGASVDAEMQRALDEQSGEPGAASSAASASPELQDPLTDPAGAQPASPPLEAQPAPAAPSNDAQSANPAPTGAAEPAEQTTPPAAPNGNADSSTGQDCCAIS